MSDFGDTYRLTRGRFDDVFSGLTHEQLNWRLHPDALTLAETAVHVAGVELSFTSQLLGTQLGTEESRVRSAATDGVVNDLPFPYSADELTMDKVQWALQIGRQAVEPLIDNVTDDLRAKQIQSALGPVIDGTGAFVRLGFHPGYHQGQAHLIKTAPGFPA